MRDTRYGVSPSLYGANFMANRPAPASFRPSKARFSSRKTITWLCEPSHRAFANPGLNIRS